MIARTTATPRTEGLFGFHPDCDFKTIEVRNNRIECIDQARPLLRRDESYGATVENNLLINVSDTHRFKNPKSGEKVGLEQPLKFECGVHGEVTVDGWTASETKPHE